MLKQRTPGGPWQIQLPPLEPGGKPFRKSTCTTNKADALRLHDEVKREYLRGRLGLTSKRTGLTLEGAHREAMRLHWNHLKSPSSAVTAYTSWAAHLGASHVLSGINQGTVMACIKVWQAEGMEGATINRKLAYLQKLRRIASEFLGETTLPAVTFPHFKETAFNPVIFTREEERSIVQWFEDQGLVAMRRLTVFLVDTGCRLGEALRAEWSHVRTVDGDFTLAIWENKASHPRTIPLTPRAALALSVGFGIPAHVAENRWQKMRAAVFPGREGVVIHGLRHTCCTRLILAGWDLARVQRWMGHKSIVTTMRYAHLNDSDLRDGVDLLTVRNPQECAEGVSDPEGEGLAPGGSADVQLLESAGQLVGGARFELATNGLKVRAESPADQHDTPPVCTRCETPG